MTVCKIIIVLDSRGGDSAMAMSIRVRSLLAHAGDSFTLNKATSRGSSQDRVQILHVLDEALDAFSGLSALSR